MPSPPPQDFKAIQEAIQTGIVTTVKSVNRLAAEDLSFHRTANPDVAEQLDDQTARLLDLSNRLLASAAQACGVKAPRPLEDVEDIELNWRGIVDVLDSVLEKVDTSLDEYTGLIKKKGAASHPNPAATTAPATKKPRSSQLERNIRFANVVKPQLAFELQPDNFPKAPWKPLLSTKPHARVPLEKSLVRFGAENSQSQYGSTPPCSPSLSIITTATTSSASTDAQAAVVPSVRGACFGNQSQRQRELLRRSQTDMSSRYKHPYESEIVNMTYPEKVSKRSDPIMYQPVETTSAKWIDTYEGVLGMLEELKKVDEIAVDLEHHDWRTYFGMVSLMQISTRDKDWIVDTLKPWRHRLQVLNEVFADPSIVKVFHGAHMDVIWLQRDLGLYLVGLFDTFFACEELYPTKSLAYLLKRFVDFDADKKYQMADWRLRPLTDEMFYYARSDTHYLLYIYDMVRKDLHAKTNAESLGEDYVERVLQKSKGQALVRYEHLESDPDTGEGTRGWRNPLLRHGNLSPVQFAVFKAVWNWRDKTARQEDENPTFLFSQQVVFDIAMILPPDAKALHSLIPPQNQIPKKNQAIASLWDLVRDARAQAAKSNGPTSHEFVSGVTTNRQLVARPAPPPSKLPGVEGILVEKMDKTRLFGDMPISSVYDDSKAAVPVQDAYVQLPWVKYLSNIKEQPRPTDSTPESMEVDNAGSAEPEKIDEEFTLKRGHKRKASERGDTGDGDFIGLDDSPLTDFETEKVRQRPSVKVMKKTARENRKAWREARATGTSDEAEPGEGAGADEGEEGADEGEVEEDAEANKQLSKKERKRLKKERKRQKKATQEEQTSQPGDGSAENDTDAEKSQEGEDGDDEFIELEDIDEEALEKERRKAKKEARQQRKQEKAAAKATKAATAGKSAEGSAEDEEAPFDYAAAASVLRAPRGGGDQSRGRRVKNFNPYAKSDTHAIKGARKAPPVAGSRSAVFKK